MTLFGLFTQYPRYCFYELWRALFSPANWVYIILYCLYSDNYKFYVVLLALPLFLLIRYMWLYITLRTYLSSHAQFNPLDFWNKYYKEDIIYVIALTIYCVCLLIVPMIGFGICYDRAVFYWKSLIVFMTLTKVAMDALTLRMRLKLLKI